MEKEKMVTEMFKKGHLLTDEALRALEGQELGAMLATQLPLVVDTKDFQKPYRITKNIPGKKAELTGEDFVRLYNTRFEKMRSIIMSRTRKSFVSLNKVGSTRSEVYVIGLVKEIREKDGKKIVELEDMTASMPVIFDDTEDLELDDVIAVQATDGGRVLFGKKIIYPDIPLRQPTMGAGKACFVSDLQLDEAPQADAERLFRWLSQEDIQYLFISGRIGDRAMLERLVDRYCYMKTAFVIADSEEPGPPDSYGSARIVSMSNPAMVEVGGLKILMARKADVRMLKKRHLGKPQAVFGEDYLVIDEVPDIVHSGSSDEPSVTNYKSVTLVNSGSLLGEFRPVVVDFSTRDVEKVALAK